MTGFTVGLGTLWRFPQLIIEHGGGSFLLVYLAASLLVALPLLVTEVVIGRRTRQNPVNAYHSLSLEVGAGTSWRLIGYTGLLTALIIASYLSLFASWSLGYMVRLASGVIGQVTPQGAMTLWGDFLSDPEKSLAWHTLFMIALFFISGRGLKRGLEWAAVRMVPLMSLVFVILLAAVWNLPGLEPAFQKVFRIAGDGVDFEGYIAAFGLAFFTFGVGFGAVMSLGSYLSADLSVVKSSLLVVLLNTSLALLVTVVLLALTANAQLELVTGPELLFQTLVVAFGELPAGDILGGLFYLSVVLISLTTAIGLVEPIVLWMVERWGFDRFAAAAWVVTLAWGLGVVSILSFNYLAFTFEFAGQSGENGAFDVLVVLTSDILVPLLALLMALIVGWRVAPPVLSEELERPREAAFNLWYLLVRYITPALVFFIFLQGIGVF